MKNVQSEGLSKEKRTTVVKTIREDDKAETEEYVVCEICGHANKRTNGLCEMCSNYLF